MAAFVNGEEFYGRGGTGVAACAEAWREREWAAYWQAPWESAPEIEAAVAEVAAILSTLVPGKELEWRNELATAISTHAPYACDRHCVHTCSVHTRCVHTRTRIDTSVSIPAARSSNPIP